MEGFLNGVTNPRLKPSVPRRVQDRESGWIRLSSVSLDVLSKDLFKRSRDRQDGFLDLRPRFRGMCHLLAKQLLQPCLDRLPFEPMHELLCDLRGERGVLVVEEPHHHRVRLLGQLPPDRLHRPVRQRGPL